MFSEIEDLMQSIDKFKTNIANSTALVASLDAVRLELEKLAAKHQEDRTKLLEVSTVLGQVASQTEGTSTALGLLAPRVDELIERLGATHQEVLSQLLNLTEQHERAQEREEASRLALLTLSSKLDLALKWSKRGFAMVMGLVVLTIAGMVLRLI